MAPKRVRCNAKECREPAQRIVGDCGFCNGHFCGKHRLLEDHKCSGLEDVSFPLSLKCYPLFVFKECFGLTLVVFGEIQCKKQSHERNAAQLEAERTQVIRGV